MAWRSWNCFLADIDDSLIRESIQALVTKTGTTGTSLGPGPSLWEAGYKSIGIDEGKSASAAGSVALRCR